MAHLIKVCCVCHEVLGRVETTAYNKDVLSHGLCEKCEKVELKKLEVLEKALAKKK
jgi:hypothetical protein